MKSSIITALCALTMACPTMRAESFDPTAADHAFTDSLVSSLVDNNKTLQISIRRANAEFLDAQGENILPTPEIGFDHLWGTGATGNKWALEVSQAFDWPGTYKARTSANRNVLEMANATIAKQRAEITFATTEKINDIVYCNRRIMVVDDMLERLSTVAAKIDEGFDHGEMTILDVRKIDYELFALRNRRTELIKERSEAIASLDDVSGTKVEGCEKLIAYPTLSLLPHVAYQESILNNSSRLEALAGAEAMRSQARVATLERLPGFSVGYNHEYEMGERFNGIKVGITLPFLSGKKKTLAAMKLAEAYEWEADLAAERRLSEVDEAYNRVTELSERLNDAKQLFSVSNDYPLLLHKAYQGGEMSLINYLLEINYYIEASMQYLDTEHEYNNQLNILNNNK